MRTVYVLMYWSDEDGMMDASTGEKSPPKLKPYAVFGDKETAEKMKREGDEVVEVPYFEDKSNKSDWYTTTSPNSIHAVPCSDRTTVTYQNTDLWGNKSTTLAPPYNTYPRVTCSNKTVDEHSWTNRVD